MKTTVLTFDQSGGLTVDHEGFVGTQCEEATKMLIGNLGAQVTRDVKKPEYNQTAQGRQQAQQRW